MREKVIYSTRDFVLRNRAIIESLNKLEQM